MTSEQKSKARKASVIYQLYFVIILLVFGLFTFLYTISFVPFQGMQESGYAVGISIERWQWITFIFVILSPLLLAFATSSKLLEGVNASNKLTRGMIFTFLWWLVPMTTAQILDGMESLGSLIPTVAAAAMASIFFGPPLGKKILSIKKEDGSPVAS
ncbi:hypothetical protein [Fulvivirga sedimenti]|uniref:Uncharacterized protein n=1 Tax=Fulvivirga sedimenti TaxID=2879465 RepID=A0A9X1HYS9_9BACT|nr:hypothetical protein [Fulvivirga sedimenti]MCA6079087.1 hypothetical protein [Fulvivirga sedimenti]